MYVCMYIHVYMCMDAVYKTRGTQTRSCELQKVLNQHLMLYCFVLDVFNISVKSSGIASDLQRSV